MTMSKGQGEDKEKGGVTTSHSSPLFPIVRGEGVGVWIPDVSLSALALIAPTSPETLEPRVLKPAISINERPKGLQ
jgi:hypothetical protein